jgi:hypothetical protein
MCRARKEPMFSDDLSEFDRSREVVVDLINEYKVRVMVMAAPRATVHL